MTATIDPILAPTVWTLTTARSAVGGLSAPSKMPCSGWSIPATECKRGSVLAAKAGTVCSGCYAMKGRYGFDNVQTALRRRLDAFNADPQTWIDAMSFLIARERSGHFRWFDSGDLQSTGMLGAIMDVAERTPGIRHWLPTRERAIVREVLRHRTCPPNLTIRVSADMVDDTPDRFEGLPRSAVATDRADPRWNGWYHCPAYSQGGECGSCRACWSTDVGVVYPQH